MMSNTTFIKIYRVTIFINLFYSLVCIIDRYIGIYFINALGYIVIFIESVFKWSTRYPYFFFKVFSVYPLYYVL